jgi:hypothetical protein
LSEPPRSPTPNKRRATRTTDLDLPMRETSVDPHQPVSGSVTAVPPGSQPRSLRQRNLLSRIPPTATAMDRGTIGNQLQAASLTRKTSPAQAASLGAREHTVASHCLPTRTRGRVARSPTKRPKVLPYSTLLWECLAV